MSRADVFRLVGDIACDFLAIHCCCATNFCGVVTCWPIGGGETRNPGSEVADRKNPGMGWLVWTAVGLTTVDIETGCNEDCSNCTVVLVTCCGAAR